MRKFLTLAAAVAMLALGSVNQAKAQEGATMATIGGTPIAKVGAIGLMFALPIVGTCGFAANNGSDLCKSIGIYPGATAPKVSSATDLQAERFASAGIDTRRAAMTAVASNVGDETRAKIVADFNRSMGYTTENMAAVR